jgi:hypothetical protein
MILGRHVATRSRPIPARQLVGLSPEHPVRNLDAFVLRFDRGWMETELSLALCTAQLAQDSPRPPYDYDAERTGESENATSTVRF